MSRDERVVEARPRQKQNEECNEGPSGQAEQQQETHKRIAQHQTNQTNAATFSQP
jgi:hypothetical protein